MPTALKSAQKTYRHLVVFQPGNSKAILGGEALKQIYEAAESGDIDKVPKEYRHLVKATITKKSIDRAFARLPDATQEEKDAYHDSVGSQMGIVVSKLRGHHDYVPGGGALPHTGTIMTEYPADDMMSVQGFLQAAEKLARRFKKASDLKFALLDNNQWAAHTLVTVVMAPISARPRAERGFFVELEYHQVTRFGLPDTDDFEVYSDVGDYPIRVPTDGEMLTFLKSPDELAAGGREPGSLVVPEEVQQDLRKQYGVGIGEGWRPGMKKLKERE